jgi:hypothetical protein
MSGMMSSLRPQARPSDPDTLTSSLRPQARPPEPETVIPYSDLEKIEKVVWAEANTEGVEGRNAVRGVIFNRLASGRFGNTVDEVLVANEFEPINTYGSVDAIPVSKDHLLRGMEEIVDYIQLGDDASQGSTFFQNTSTTGSRGTKFKGNNPIKIGKHTFYSSYGNQEPVEDLWGSHNINVTPDDFMEADIQLAQAEFALGGLATARRGITTQAGHEMADNRFQLDQKRADKNKDGKLSKTEELEAEASQKVGMYHGGMACDSGMMADPMMPIGAISSEVMDDLDVKISEGEYVLPGHVVRWHGLKHIMDMQSEAEMGLMMMQSDGLIQEVDKDGSEKKKKPDSKGAKDSEISDEDNTKQEEKEILKTPEGNEIEVAGVTTTIEEPEVNETEDYKESDYGKKTSMFATMKKPKATIIV